MSIFSSLFHMAEDLFGSDIEQEEWTEVMDEARSKGTLAAHKKIYEMEGKKHTHKADLHNCLDMRDRKCGDRRR